jgi:hypothetical protein
MKLVEDGRCVEVFESGWRNESIIVGKSLVETLTSN